jgi:hypothetical protein
MAAALKPGARYRSTTCTTEIVVVRSAGDADLRCGGAPMVEAGAQPTLDAAPAAPFDQGTLIGKRYLDDEARIEVLCVRAGSGSLSLGRTALVVQGAKPLPASD